MTIVRVNFIQFEKFFKISIFIASRPVRKAILIGVVLALMNQLTGCVAMIQYTATIFEKTGSALSPNASTIVVGVMQLIGTYISTLMVERAGRKVLNCIYGSIYLESNNDNFRYLLLRQPLVLALDYWD